MVWRAKIRTPTSDTERHDTAHYTNQRDMAGAKICTYSRR